MPEGAVCMNALSGLKTALEGVWCDLSWWYANRCCWLDSIHLARKERRNERKDIQLIPALCQISLALILAVLFCKELPVQKKCLGFFQRFNFLSRSLSWFWVSSPPSNDNLSGWLEYKQSSLLLLFWFQCSIHKPKQYLSLWVTEPPLKAQLKTNDIANNSSFLSSCSWIEALLSKSMGGPDALSQAVKRMGGAMLWTEMEASQSVIYANSARRSCS